MLFNRRQIRRFQVIAVLLSMSAGLSMILYALNDNIIYYYEPHELIESKQIDTYIKNNNILKLGGLVIGKTVNEKENLNYKFTITDNKNTFNIQYQGILPPMFRGEQGVVAKGILINKNTLNASELLTKHNEDYRVNTDYDREQN